MSLSTPHGTLGTSSHLSFERDFVGAFNSTRYIRNTSWTDLAKRLLLLSTPHGTLGTQAIREQGIDAIYELSTPHGTLGTSAVLKLVDFQECFQLHTVH